jgi:hypothetical protein
VTGTRSAYSGDVAASDKMSSGSDAPNALSRLLALAGDAQSAVWGDLKVCEAPSSDCLSRSARSAASSTGIEAEVEPRRRRTLRLSFAFFLVAAALFSRTHYVTNVNGRGSRSREGEARPGLAVRHIYVR